MRLDGGSTVQDADLILGGGEIDYQRFYDANEGVFQNVYLSDPNQSSLPRASWHRRTTYRWFGGTTLTSEATEHMTVSAGLDVRRYVGIHYRAVEDLVEIWLVWRWTGVTTMSLMIRPSQLVTNISTTMRVMWLGVVDSVMEWDHYNWSASPMSTSLDWYKGVDFFRPKIIDIDGVTYEVIQSREEVAGTFDCSFIARRGHLGFSKWFGDRGR